MANFLLSRCHPNCIHGYREAAKIRFEDGLLIEQGGWEHRTGAIYLWGYTAEMTVKAAYFSAIGFDADREIRIKDLHDAANVGATLSIPWPPKGKLHNVRAWTELLVMTRSSLTTLAYPDTTFRDQVVDAGLRLEPLWSEELRYHGTVAYEQEFRSVKNTAAWFLENALQL
jgi:hypothetical protein